ncbi:MAG TPA: hypothetical protein PLZ62_00010 [bacterium]|nr:hypothetical protein [bacterium]
MKNNDKKYFWLANGVGLMGIIMFFAPIIWPIDMYDGGGAMIFIGIFLAICGPIISLLFWHRMRVFDELKDETKLIVRWQYDQYLWESFVQEEISFRAGEQKWMQLVVLFFCVVIGGIFWLADPEPGRWVLLVLLGINILIALIVWLNNRAVTGWKNSRQVECRINDNGLIINNQLHVWRGWGARLENVRDSRNKIHLLEITYSTPSRYSRQYYTIRIPIPTAAEKNLPTVLKTISALI